MDALQKEILDEARKKSAAIEKGAAEEAEAAIREAKAKANAANEAFERELKDEIGRISLEYKSSREMQERNILLAAREQSHRRPRREGQGHGREAHPGEGLQEALRLRDRRGAGRSRRWRTSPWSSTRTTPGT